MFNQVQKGQQKVDDALFQEMMGRCIPVAKAILKVIVDSDLEIGEKMIPRDAEGNAVRMSMESRPAAYQAAAKQIQELMLEKNLKWMERNMVFMLVKQPMDMLQNIVLTDLETTYQTALCKMFGIEVFSDLDFNMINSLCKQWLTKPEVEAEPVDEVVEEPKVEEPKVEEVAAPVEEPKVEEEVVAPVEVIEPTDPSRV